MYIYSFGKSSTICLSSFIYFLILWLGAYSNLWILLFCFCWSLKYKSINLSTFYWKGAPWFSEARASPCALYLATKPQVTFGTLMRLQPLKTLGLRSDNRSYRTPNLILNYTDFFWCSCFLIIFFFSLDKQFSHETNDIIPLFNLQSNSCIKRILPIYKPYPLHDMTFESWTIKSLSTLF